MANPSFATFAVCAGRAYRCVWRNVPPAVPADGGVISKVAMRPSHASSQTIQRRSSENCTSATIGNGEGIVAMRENPPSAARA